MSKKMFSLKSQKPPRPEPIMFGLGDEWFTCEDDIPAAAAEALVSYGAIQASIAFVRGVVVDSDVARFNVVIARKGRNQTVTDDIIAQVADHLVGVYTNRPTSPPEPLPGGRQATMDESEGNYSSTVDDPL